MRILGVSELWPKLLNDSWTTFRFTRRDRDWEVGEEAQIVYKPRARRDTERGLLGQAAIVKMAPRWVISPDQSHLILEPIRQNPEWDHIHIVTEAEAQMDGFESREAMIQWIAKAHDCRNFLEPMNKIRLRWTQVWLWVWNQAPDTCRKWAKMHETEDLKFGSHGAEPSPMIIHKSGNLVPIVWELEKMKNLGIPAPELVIGRSEIGEATL